MDSAKFTCKCGKQKGWISDGQTLGFPCPHCGRKYRGKYNKENLSIDAIEIGRIDPKTLYGDNH